MPSCSVCRRPEAPATQLPPAKVTRLHVNPRQHVRGGGGITGPELAVPANRGRSPPGRQTPRQCLLASRDRHPERLARSGQVGRNLMKLQLSAILQLATSANSAPIPASLGVNDY